MQLMAAPLKHLIDLAPTDAIALAPRPAACRVASALAGDCSSSLGERLRIVEVECGFGERCSRGCHSLPPPDCGFVGMGRSIVSRVAEAADASGADNAQSFVPADLP